MALSGGGFLQPGAILFISLSILEEFGGKFGTFMYYSSRMLEFENALTRIFLAALFATIHAYAIIPKGATKLAQSPLEM
jgi:hypothetical protein